MRLRAAILAGSLLSPIPALAQSGVCGVSGTIDQCQNATSLSSSDLVLVRQTTQVPHTRNATIAQLLATPGAGSWLLLSGGTVTGRVAVTPPSSSTNDPTWLQSTYNVSYTGGSASHVHFNSVDDTHITSVPGDSIWNHLDQLSTTTGSSSIFGTQTQVAGYVQAVRNAITGGSSGVALEGLVVEYHDMVDAPTSVRGFGVPLEVDFSANGADDAGVTGLVSLDISQSNLAGSDNVVGNGIGIFGGAHAYLQRAFMVGSPFSQAGFDTRQATQMTGAHAIWLANGQDMALSTDGTMNITRGGGGTIDFRIGGVAAQVNSQSQVIAPGGFNTGGAFTSTAVINSGATVFDARSATVGTGANALWLGDNKAISFNTGGTAQMRWNSVTQRLESVFNGGTQAWVDASGNAAFGGTVTAGASSANTFATPGNTITLSGGTIPTLPAAIGVNWAGSSTVSGQTSLANLSVTSASDGAALTGSSAGIGYVSVQANTATGFQGGRVGVFAQLILNAATTLHSAQDGLVGLGSKVIGAANGGGVTTGFGVSNFGMGSIFGANPWATLHSGATFYNELVGQEVDASIETGASASAFAIQQLILTSDHAVQGVRRDAGMTIAAQEGAAAGVRTAIMIGDPDSQWPVDANGYLFTASLGQNNSPNPSTAAGGIDLLMADFTGTGLRGGGFAYRSQGFQILNNGVGQFGYGSLNGTSGGLVIDTPYKQMSGTPTVSAGGANWSTGDIAQDTSGNIVRVTAAAGVVTSVTVLKRGWQTSAPSNPVAFTSLTRTGTALGSGLTLTETWTGSSTLQLNPSGDTIAGSGAAIATSATTGFFHLPFSNGTPTGVPATTSVPCQWNDTSKTINCYSPGAAGWYHFTFTSGAA